MARHSRDIFELLDGESSHVLLLQEARTHDARAQGDEASLSGSGAFCALGCQASASLHCEARA